MAMTTVLPEPVAILKASRGQAGVGRVVGFAEVVLDPGVAELLGDLGDVDGRFEGLDLAEEELLLAVGIGPVFEQAGGGRRDADVAALRATSSTRWRMWLTILFSSIRSWVHSVSKTSCLPFFLGLAIGMK